MTTLLFDVMGTLVLDPFFAEVPRFFGTDLKFAMRASAAIAVAMMFYCGVVWGRYAGIRPWKAGAALVVLGVAVEAIIIALGG